MLTLFHLCLCFYSFSLSGSNILQFDLNSGIGPYLKLAKIDSKQYAAISLIDLKGLPGQGYYLNCYVGTPAQEVKLLIDTGSANLAVASEKLSGVSTWFNASLSSSIKYQKDRIHLNYQQGSWSGRIATDYIDLVNPTSPLLKKPPRLYGQIALIDEAVDFFLGSEGVANWNGIVGLAFSNIAVQPSGLTGISYVWIKYLFSLEEPIPPPISSTPYLMPSTHSILEEISSQYGIPDRFSVLLCGTSKLVTGNNLSGTLKQDGLIIFGGYNESLKVNKNSFIYTPIRYAWYYEVILTDFRVNGIQVVDDCKELNFDKTIIDTGTTNIRLPRRVFDSFLKLLKAFVNQKDLKAANLIGEKFWQGKSVLCQSVTTPLGGSEGLPYTLFPTLTFDLALVNLDSDEKVLRLTLSPEQYIRYIGRIPSKGQIRDCFVFGVQRDPIGTILGSVFIEGFYTIFDRKKMRIGFTDSTCAKYSSVKKVSHSSVIGEMEWIKPNNSKWLHRYPWVRETRFPIDCAFYRPDFSPFRRRLWGIRLWHATFIVATLLFLLLFVLLIILFFRIFKHCKSYI